MPDYHITWQDPFLLRDYREAPTAAGIYMVCEKIDYSEEVTANSEIDAYMFNWPNNLRCIYVGISESMRGGIRARLRSHYKRRGNKDIAGRLINGEELWAVAAAGNDLAGFEALYLAALKGGGALGANVRCENSRFGRRLNRSIEKDLRAKGIEPSVFDPTEYMNPWELLEHDFQNSRKRS